MKQNALATLFSLSLLTLAAACGNSSSDASSTPSQCTGPQSMSSAPPACSSCIQAACSQKLSAYCSAGCTTSDASSTCQHAVQDVENCIVNNCSSQCGGGDASGAGGAGEPSGSAGTGTSSAGRSSGSGAGSGGTAAGGTIAACYIAAQSSCTAAPVPASEKAALDDQCTQAGGVASDRCPKSGLIGCCTFGFGSAASSQVCSYKAGSGFDEASCSSASGTWSTSP